MPDTNYFDKVAIQWDDMRKGFFPNAVREKAVSVSEIKKGQIAADIGAGTGFVTELLLERGAEVIAVDHSIEMLRVLINKFCCDYNLTVKKGHDKRIPLGNESVDYVFANMYLHHVEDPQIAINEMVRILKPGGQLIITDLDEHDFDFLVKEQNDKWKGFKRDALFNWYENAGLTDININCINENCCAASQEDQKEVKISIFIARGSKNNL